MMFSVLMSIYIKENPEFLIKAIESILEQTISPNEIVIVKDGVLNLSLDKVIETYREHYPNLFKIVELSKNQGLGTALQVGVEHCSNDVIARMDTDDIAKNDRFEKQLKILEDYPEIDVVGSYIDEFDEEVTNIISKRKVPITNMEIYSGAKRRNPLNHMTVMFRKTAVLNAGNYKPFLWNEDYYLWVRMILNGSKMINIPESLVYARTGHKMFERRGGYKYVLQEISLQKEFLRLNFISRADFCFNIFIRTTVRIIPNRLRGFIYTYFLHVK